MNAYVLVSRKLGNSRNLDFCIARNSSMKQMSPVFKKTKQIFKHRTSTFQAGMMPVYICILNLIWKWQTKVQRLLIRDMPEFRI